DKPQAKADVSTALGRDLPPTGATSTDTIWFDDSVPQGAVRDSNNDSWNWVRNPAAESGTLSHQSSLRAGMHQHMFTKAKQTLSVTTGESVYTYVYIDPANVPSEIMLQWYDGSTWYHRAYWGANNLSFITKGAASLHYMGPIPAAGQWVRLEVPADQVGLEGVTVSGMAFSLYGGRVNWDNSGKSTPVAVVTPPPTNSIPDSTNSIPAPTNSVPGTNSTSSTNDVVWINDALPANAVPDYMGGDTWNWVTSNPTPQLGTKAHQSAIGS